MASELRRGALRVFLTLAGAASLALASSCLERWDDAGASGGETRCASCHGDPARAGDFLQRSAPPHDLLGASDSSYPGVGAHTMHVLGSATHGGVACRECHVVPEQTNAPGHADDARPAEIVFGELARSGGREPSYDFAARTCSDSYCHRDARAVWTEPRSSAEACGSCHGLPPPAPHPQSERCESCHAEVVDSVRAFVAPELHVNGRVEVADGACTSCHGMGDDPAPPFDVDGSDRVSALGVGAHQAHLQGGPFTRPLACAECHLVPERADEPGHADALPAEIVFSGPASALGSMPVWDRASARCSDTYCHGPSTKGTRSPSWVEPAELGCASCHGLPPAAPHPQLTDCSQCHAEIVAADDRTILERERHVDGFVDADFDGACTSCHGSDNAAPPVDLSGRTSPSALGVGAHQVHLAGTSRSRAVPCAECHVVPADVLDPGHLDSAAPAEVVFSGAAAAFGGTPAYANGTCTNTSCHGAVFPLGHDSGGLHTTPIWNRVDGSQAPCGSCHGLPPPAPHPYYAEDCNRCHENVAADGQTFLRPDLHVDGIVTFTLP